MDIVHLTFSLETGGAENLLIDIVNEQSKTDRVSVFVINNRIDLSMIERINSNVKIYPLNREPGNKFNFSTS